MRASAGRIFCTLVTDVLTSTSHQLTLLDYDVKIKSTQHFTFCDGRLYVSITSIDVVGSMTSILNPPNTIYFSFCDVAITQQPTLYIPHSRQVYEFNITDLIKPARLWQILSRQSPFTITISHRKKLRLTRASISPRFAICRNLSWKALRKWQQIHILLLNATVYPYIKSDVKKGNQPFQSVRKARSSDWWNLWPHTGKFLPMFR